MNNTVPYRLRSVCVFAFLFLVLSGLARRSAADQVVAFQLYDVVFSDGSVGTGTFDYDFTKSSASKVSIYAGGGWYNNASNAPVHINKNRISGTYDTAQVSDALRLSFAHKLDPVVGATISLNPSASSLVLDNSPDGDHVVTLSVVSGRVLPVASLPSTKASLTGNAGTNGWFTTPVAVKLTAKPGAHHIAATYYILDGGATQSYTSPFLISSEAVHDLTYWSVDTAGFVETAHTVQIGIDATPPTTTYTRYGETINLTSNDAVSGVEGIYYTVNGGATQTYTGAIIAPVGTDTVSFWSVDVAGNVEAQQTLSFTTGDTVPPTEPGAPHWADSATIAWTASTDNVGVAGYAVYVLKGHSGRGGGQSWVLIMTTTATQAVLGSSYKGWTLGVQAYDAAGNKSAIAAFN